MSKVKNTIHKPVTRTAFVRSTTDQMLAKRQVEFVISTEAVDTYNTVFKLDGWDLQRYAKNPIVCYQHRANSDDPDNVIGTSEVFIEDNQLIGRVTFEEADVNPKADKVFRKVQNGTLKMASINAMPSKARMGVFEDGENPEVLYFTEQQLTEWSVVSVGSNPDAHKRNADTVDQYRLQAKAEATQQTEDLKKTEDQPEKRETLSVYEAQVLINSNL